MVQAVHAETGITVHPDMFAKALKLAQIFRVKGRAKGSFQTPELRKSMATPRHTDVSCRSSASGKGIVFLLPHLKDDRQHVAGLFKRRCRRCSARSEPISAKFPLLAS